MFPTRCASGMTRISPRCRAVFSMTSSSGARPRRGRSQILRVHRGRRGEPDLNGQPDLAAAASGSRLGRGSASAEGWRPACPLLAFAHDRVAQGGDAGDLDVGRVAVLEVFGSALGDPILTTSSGQRVKYRLRWEHAGENEFKVSSDSPLEGGRFEPSVPLFARLRLSSGPKAAGECLTAA